MQGESKFIKKDERFFFKVCDLTMFGTQRAVVISAGEQEDTLVDKTREITKMISTSNFDLMFILFEVRNQAYQHSI